MIKGRRASFEARCRERGYDLATAWSCVVEEDGDFITVDETHPAYPRSSTAPPPPFQRPSGGAGTELKALLAKIGIVASPGCSCNKRADVMNRNGIHWCEQNVETICDWLQEEATKRKLPFVRLAGKALIHLAIRRAKKGNNK